MQAIIKALNALCIAVTLLFFAIMVLMVGGHIVGLFTLNGGLAAGATAVLRPIAGRVAAVAAISAFILSYLRKLAK